MRRLRHIIRKCRIRMGLCTVRAMYDYRKSRERGREVRVARGEFTTLKKKNHTQKNKSNSQTLKIIQGIKGKEAAAQIDRQTKDMLCVRTDRRWWREP